jgi:tRNA pseudouridine55 synthase
MNKFIEGQVLLINKPYKWTSFDAVNKIKYLIKSTLSRPSSLDPSPPVSLSNRPSFKIGHAGTLDPLATGLLIMCTGKFTKRIEEFQAQEKEYTGTICLGATTPCFDLEKPIDAHYPTEHITPEAIYGAVKKFTGTIQQVPPIFSAVKVKGKRAYDLARKGETPEMKPKTITISIFEITNINMPYVDFRVVCSKGTYIRSLARDLGLALNSGGHLTALCRTRIGEFHLDQALEIQQFENELA